MFSPFSLCCHLVFIAWKQVTGAAVKLWGVASPYSQQVHNECVEEVAGILAAKGVGSLEVKHEWCVRQVFRDRAVEMKFWVYTASKLRCPQPARTRVLML
jgi:hypothetical protein